MKNNQNNLFVNAALAGILAAGTLALSSTALAEGKPTDKGHCMGSNACKGHSACKTEKNACKGQNGCKGEGFTDSTRGACEKMAKSNKNISFVVPKN